MASLQPLGRSAWSRQLNNIDLHIYDLQYTRPKYSLTFWQNYTPQIIVEILGQKVQNFNFGAGLSPLGYVEHLRT